MSKYSILIIGGGFGGVKAALDLADNPDINVKIVSDQTDFRYYPALYRSATGGTKRLSSIPLSVLFNEKPVDIIFDRATKLDRKNRVVTTEGGKKLGYDSLILSLGVQTNYFGIKGLERYSYGIKSLDEAIGLKHHLHQQLIDKHQPDFNYVVIGAGPTGVELAAALPAYIRHLMKMHGVKNRAARIELIEAAPRVLPHMPKDVSRAVTRRLRRLGVKLYLGKSVEGETSEALMVDGKPIRSNTVVWTAGVTNHPFFKTNSFPMAANGKVAVDQYLSADKNIYVIGDNANTPYSGMAQTALYDARYVANNIKRQLSGKEPEFYKPKKPVYVTPAGAHWAAVLWGRFRIYGRPGWVLRQAADFLAFRDLEPFIKASKQFMNEYDSEETCPYCLLQNES